MTEKQVTEQGPQEKATTPWRVRFTCEKAKPSYNEIRKDLLTACWGNSKMADLLFHFLVVASWEAHNTHLDAATRKVVVQETHAKIQTKVKSSEPTLVSHLKAFAKAGYVRKTAYRGAFEVDFEAIEKAFTEAPEKQSTSAASTDDLSLNLSLSREVEGLRLEVQKLREQVEDLSLTLVSFKLQHAQPEHEFKFDLSLPLVSADFDEAATEANLARIFKFGETKELYLNNSSGLALVAAPAPQNCPKNLLDIRVIEDLDKESVEGANAPHTPDPVVNLPYVPDWAQPSTSQTESRIANDTTTEDTSHGQEHPAHSPAPVAGGGDHRPGGMAAGGAASGKPATPAGSARAEVSAAVERAGDTTSQQAAETVAPAGGSGYRTPAEVRAAQATSTGGQRQQSARTQGKKNSTHRTSWSLEGTAFKGWYEEIFGVRLDDTAANARACNSLGNRESVTYENVKLVKGEIDKNKWARTNNVAVTPQDLADDDGKIRWDKWLTAAQQRVAREVQKTPPSQGDNNLADWIAEAQQQPQLSREESDRRMEEARAQLAAVQAQIAARKATERQQQSVIYRVKGESYAQ